MPLESQPLKRGVFVEVPDGVVPDGLLESVHSGRVDVEVNIRRCTNKSIVTRSRQRGAFRFDDWQYFAGRRS